MTCGDAYRQIIAEYQRGIPRMEIAEHLGVSLSFIHSTISRYRCMGDKLFESQRELKKTYYSPSEYAIWANMRRNEIMEQSAAREMAALRRSIVEGDKIMIGREEGNGINKHLVEKEITVTYVGREYILGTTEKGIKESTSIHDLWLYRNQKSCACVDDV